MTCLGEPIDDVLIDQIMVLMLLANSERVGAGTCPCLNPGAYFLLGIFDEQFDLDNLHRVDRGSPPPTSPPPCRHRPRCRPVHRLPNSERIGAGTCPCLNPRAYFLLGIFDEQFDLDHLHGVDRGSPPPNSPPPLLPPCPPPPSPPPSPPPPFRAMHGAD